MERIEGYVDHIIYRNQDNGYTVMNVIADGKEITCVGPASLYWRGRAGGDHRPLQGSCHLRRASFRSRLCEMKAPEDELSIERYLGSGAVKGIGVCPGSPDRAEVP